MVPSLLLHPPLCLGRSYLGPAPCYPGQHSAARAQPPACSQRPFCTTEPFPATLLADLAFLVVSDSLYIYVRGPTQAPACLAPLAWLPNSLPMMLQNVHLCVRVFLSHSTPRLPLAFSTWCSYAQVSPPLHAPCFCSLATGASYHPERFRDLSYLLRGVTACARMRSSLVGRHARTGFPSLAYLSSCRTTHPHSHFSASLVA